MARDALIRALRQVELLDGLAPLQITEIARCADRIVFKPGARIMTANQPADAAVVLVTGHAKRLSGPGHSANAQPLPPGTTLAELAMLIDMVPNSTVVAVSEVRALRLTRDEMHRLIADDSALGEHFIAKAATRLQSIAQQMRLVESDLSRRLESGRSPTATTEPRAPSSATSPDVLAAS